VRLDSHFHSPGTCKQLAAVGGIESRPWPEEDLLIGRPSQAAALVLGLKVRPRNESVSGQQQSHPIGLPFSQKLSAGESRKDNEVPLWLAHLDKTP